MDRRYQKCNNIILFAQLMVPISDFKKNETGNFLYQIIFTSCKDNRDPLLALFELYKESPTVQVGLKQLNEKLGDGQED